MAFEWVSFLDRHGIEYRTQGKSTAKDNVYIHCVFCGQADEGHHMGISLANRGWGCWKDDSHRGRNPARLIKALTGASWDEVQALLGGGKRPVGDLLGAVRNALGELPSGSSEGLELAPKIELPEHFRALKRGSVHYEYLRAGRERNFSHDEIDFLKRRFNLRQVSSSADKWRWRMIIPVYDQAKDLQTWTARAVGEANLRYKSLSTNPEKEAADNHGCGFSALLPITDCMLGSHRLKKGGRFLILSEGFFDAAAFSLESRAFNARETALFGKVASPAQMDMLADICPLYDATFLLLDPDAKFSALKVASQMQALGVETFRLDGDADPGDRGPKAIRRLLSQMENRVSIKRK